MTEFTSGHDDGHERHDPLHMVRGRRSICTYSGREFFPLAPDPADVALPDIASALSKKCRYTGQCGQFYSIAQHSVLVSLHLEHRMGRPDLALAGMFHDAGEAYLPDVASPLKGALFFQIGDEFVPFRDVEHTVLWAVQKRFDIPGMLDPAVKIADSALFRSEQPILFAHCDTEWWKLPLEPDPAVKTLGLWDHNRSWTEWMDRTLRLFAQIGELPA